MAIVAGPNAHRGRNHALVVDRLRTSDGTDYAALEYFPSGGGYLTAEPD